MITTSIVSGMTLTNNDIKDKKIKPLENRGTEKGTSEKQLESR